MPGAVEFFHRHSSSSGLEGTAGFTLVMPSVSVGNVGQLSMDLIIGSVVGEKVGCLYHEAILPFAGPHPFQLHSTPTLSTSCEVYKDTGRKLLLLQIRSPILQHKRKEFVESLISWIKTLSVDRIVVLTSCFDYERNDEQIRGSPLRFMATPPTLQQRLENELSWEILKGSTGDVNERVMMHGGGVANHLFQRCEEEKVPCITLVKYCSEGDNIPDAFMLADFVDRLLQLKQSLKLSKWKVPVSWSQLFGNQPPDTVY